MYKKKNIESSCPFLKVVSYGEEWARNSIFHATRFSTTYLSKHFSLQKESFIKAASSKQNQYFLEWFTETAMFTHFIQNMAASYHHHMSPESPHPPPDLVDTPLPNFYELFDERVRGRKTGNKNLDSSKNNYKNAVNKKVKFLKSKLRELVA